MKISREQDALLTGGEEHERKRHCCDAKKDLPRTSSAWRAEASGVVDMVAILCAEDPSMVVCFDNFGEVEVQDTLQLYTLRNDTQALGRNRKWY